MLFLAEELLHRFAERCASYGRDNRFFRAHLRRPAPGDVRAKGSAAILVNPHETEAMAPFEVSLLCGGLLAAVIGQICTGGEHDNRMAR